MIKYYFEQEKSQTTTRHFIVPTIVEDNVRTLAGYKTTEDLKHFVPTDEMIDKGYCIESTGLTLAEREKAVEAFLEEAQVYVIDPSKHRLELCHVTVDTQVTMLPISVVQNKFKPGQTVFLLELNGRFVRVYISEVIDSSKVIVKPYDRSFEEATTSICHLVAEDERVCVVETTDGLHRSFDIDRTVYTSKHIPAKCIDPMPGQLQNSHLPAIGRVKVVM